MIRSERLDVFKLLDKDGLEIPDDQPIEIPAGFKVPEALDDMIRRLVKSEEMIRIAESGGAETFEESEDFDVDDDMFDPSSPYEEVFDPTLGRGITLDEFNRNHAIYQERFLKAEEKAYEAMHISDALRGIPRRPGEQSGPKAAQEPPAKSTPAPGSSGST